MRFRTVLGWGCLIPALRQRRANSLEVCCAGRFWRLRGLEIAYLGVPCFAGLGMTHQDRLQVQDLTNAKTPTLDGDPGAGLDPKTALHTTTPQDFLSHIRLCIVSGWLRSAPICRIAISCHNMGNIWACCQRSWDSAGRRLAGSVSSSSNKTFRIRVRYAALMDIAWYDRRNFTLSKYGVRTCRSVTTRNRQPCCRALRCAARNLGR